MDDVRGNYRDQPRAVSKMNRAKVDSLLSTRPIVMGLTIIDIYWVIEAIVGVCIVWAALADTDVKFWFNGNAAFFGTLMIIFAGCRVFNILEDEVNAFMSLALVLACTQIFGIKPDMVADQLSKAAPTITYYAQVPQPASLQSTPAKACEWYNTAKNIKLTPSQGEWCAKEVTAKNPEANVCACK